MGCALCPCPISYGMELEAKIEADLFFKSQPITLGELAKLVGADKNSIDNALSILEHDLSGRGVQIVRNKEEVELRTAPELSSLIETIRKEELTKDLGKAGAETLSIILYREQVTRAEIDYIRGVNSTFILRNLLIRGLVERKTNSRDHRSFLYKPTLELISFLGVKNVTDLPEYETVVKQLEDFMSYSEKDG